MSSNARPAAGGGRWVEVPPERLAGWIEGFAARHGAVAVSAGGGGVLTLAGADGAVAEIHPPFPPVLPAGGPAPAGDPPPAGGPPSDAPAGEGAPVAGGPLGGLIAHALRPRRVGVLLVRLGGHAAGVFDGTELVISKVDSRLVHGRHKKGGSSQQRFARRREGEVRVAVGAAADVAARILLPEVRRLDAVVLGGDRRAVDLVLADRRLAPLAAKVAGPFLTVPDPRRAVLETAPAAYRAVRIRVVDQPG